MEINSFKELGARLAKLGKEQNEIRRQSRSSGSSRNSRANDGSNGDAVQTNFSPRGNPNAPGLENARTRGRRRIQDEILNPNPPSEPVDVPSSPPGGTEPTPPVENTPVETAPVSEVKPDSTLLSLAERYVDQYQEQGGRSLSTEERSSLVQNVYSFYSEPERSGRLEQIVFKA